MTLEKVFLQVGRELDSQIAQARRAINQAIAADLNNLVAEGNGLPKRRGPAPKFSVAAPVRGKPGPKPKGQPPIAKGKPGPKPKAGKASATSDSSVARGRRAVASGDRPKVVDAVATVIGSHVMTAKEVVDALANRGWSPNSGKPQNYINFILSSHKEMFECVSRGAYRVIKGVKVSRSGKARGDTSQEAEVSEETSEASAPAVDEALADLGISSDGEVAQNPFAGE